VQGVRGNLPQAAGSERFETGRSHFQLNTTPIMVRPKNPAIHGEFTLLTVTDGRKVGSNPINICGVVVDFAEV
jgi:hypothetical protein